MSKENELYTDIDGVLYDKSVKHLLVYPEGKNDCAYEVAESVTYIGDYAFYLCRSMKSIKLSDNTNSIGVYAFSSCSNLECITIPEKVVTINNRAFYDCTSLTSIVFLSPDTNIYDSSLTINSTATIYGYAGSTAEAYAEKYGRTFVSLSGASDFNEYIYRADSLLSDRLIDDEGKDISTLDHIIACDKSGSEILIAALEDKNISTKVAAWNTVKLLLDSIENPLASGEFVFSQKDLYIAKILSAFNESNTWNMSDAISVLNNERGDLPSAVSSCKNLLESHYGFVNIKELSKKDIANIGDELEKGYKKAYPEFTAVSKVFEYYSLIAESASTIDELINLLNSYLNIYMMSESKKDMLESMYKICPSYNKPLKEALHECSEIINMSIDEFVLKCIAKECMSSVTGVGIKALVDEAWNSVLDDVRIAHPSLAVIMAIYNASDYLCNTLFSTNKVISQYYEMICAYELRELAANVVENYVNTYNHTEKSAKRLLDSIDVLFEFIYNDMDTAIEFCNIADDTLYNDLGQIITGEDISKWDDVKEYGEKIKNKYALYDVDINVSWIYSLKNDYPVSGLFEKYQPLIKGIAKTVYDKEYIIACPVNVYIYNSNGDLAAFVENEEPRSLVNDIAIFVKSNAKTIKFLSDTQYRIVLNGYDTGTMDIKISEYSSGGTLGRNADFNDVELFSGSKHETITKIVQSEESEYIITNSNSLSQNADYDSLLCTQTTYNISVENGYICNNDTFAFSGKYHPGQRITIVGYKPNGYVLNGWSSNIKFKDLSDTTITFVMPSYDVVISPLLSPIIGDINKDNIVDNNDAIYLLYYTIFGEEGGYTVNQDCDFNGDGMIDNNDAIYLLYHTIFGGEYYPLS